MIRKIILESRKLNNFRDSALGFGEFCEIHPRQARDSEAQGVTVLRVPSLSREEQQASGLLRNARGVKPLWKIATKWLILFCLLLYQPLTAAENEDVNKYLEIIKKEPGNFQAYNKAGLAYAQKGDQEEAEKYFKNSIIVNNNYYEGYFNLGLLYYQQKNFNKAIENFKRCYSINMKNVGLYVVFINTSLKLNKITRAKEYFNKGYKLFKETDHRLLNCGGVIELLCRNYKKARTFFSKALELKDNNKIKNNLAIVEYKLGNKKKAKEILKSIGKSLDIMSENYKLIK